MRYYITSLFFKALCLGSRKIQDLSKMGAWVSLEMVEGEGKRRERSEKIYSSMKKFFKKMPCVK